MHAGSEDLVLVVMPTYEERENLAATIGRTLEATPDHVHVLVVDDASPDGTGRLADRLAEEHARVHVLHRTAKEGLGPAYRAGFTWALAHGCAAVIEMDADGSHDGADVVRLLDGLRTHDVVLGSRWVRGGGVVDWPLRRHLLSRGGNAYVRLLLGIRIHDATGGFRAYRSDMLRALHLETVASQGYCFQVDMLWRALRQGFRVAEVPITFRDRARGASKMHARIVVESLWRVTAWGVAHRARPVVEAVRSRLPPLRLIRP